LHRARRTAGIAAKMNYTDIDIIRFLTNVECLEGLFDTWGTFGHGFINNLELGGPTPIGAKAAKLTEATRPFLEEVALNEQVRCAGRTGRRPDCARVLCSASVRSRKGMSGRAAA
jgi:hypothetical protein